MQINGQPSTSGTVIIHPGEVATIATPIGDLAVQVEHRPDAASQALFENGVVKLINFEGGLGTNAHFGLGTPQGGLNLRFSATSANAGDIHTVHYTAVKS